MNVNKVTWRLDKRGRGYAERQYHPKVYNSKQLFKFEPSSLIKIAEQPTRHFHALSTFNSKRAGRRVNESAKKLHVMNLLRLTNLVSSIRFVVSDKLRQIVCTCSQQRNMWQRVDVILHKTSEALKKTRSNFFCNSIRLRDQQGFSQTPYVDENFYLARWQFVIPDESSLLTVSTNAQYR